MATDEPYPPDRHAKIHSLFCYWQSLPKTDGIPARKAFDPIAVPSLLPNIWLIDVIQPTLRYRYRLVGTAIAEARGYDQTGRFIDEEVANFATSQTCLDLAKVLGGEVSWRRGKPDRLHRLTDIYSLERIFLPLSSGEAAVGVVLALTVYVSVHAPARRG